MTAPAIAPRTIRLTSEEIAFAIAHRRQRHSFDAIAAQLGRSRQQVTDAVCTVEVAEFLAHADQLRVRIGCTRAQALFLQCADACG